MNRIQAAAVAVVAGVLVAMAASEAAQAERKLSIMALMHKQYDVSRAPFVQIKKEMYRTSPDWEKIEAAAGDFLALAEALGKNEPRRGDKESWTKLTGLHVADARALQAAAKSHDREALRNVHRRLAAACKACHDAHKYRPEN